MKGVIVNYLDKLWALAKKESRRKFLNQLVERNPQATLLDCGCDDGSFTIEIAQCLETRRIYGIDTNKIRAINAKERGIKVFNSDLNRKFPFEDSFFDVVTAAGVIEHMIDLDNFISEMYRVLKPGKYGVIDTENLAATHNIFALLCGNQPYSGPTLSYKNKIGHHPIHPVYNIKETPYEALIPQHTRVMAYKALKEVFKTHNFIVENMFCAGYFPFPKLIAKLLCRIDRWHSAFIGIKVRKRS